MVNNVTDKDKQQLNASILFCAENIELTNIRGTVDICNIVF